MNEKKEKETTKSLRIEDVSKKLAASTPHYSNSRRPRSRAKYDALKMIERKTGRVTGTIGNRVWVDDSDHDKGFYELDEGGNEVDWYPYPAKKGDKMASSTERVIVNVAAVAEKAREYIAYFDGYNEHRKEAAELMRDVLLQMEKGPFNQERFDELVERNSDDAHRNADTKKMVRSAAIELGRTPEELKKREEIKERLRKDPFTSDKVREVPPGTRTPWGIVGQKEGNNNHEIQKSE